jgi:hypothetical protein
MPMRCGKNDQHVCEVWIKGSLDGTEKKVLVERSGCNPPSEDIVEDLSMHVVCLSRNKDLFWVL